jgi:hypothetical protein
MPLPLAHLEHEVPGRARLRIPSRRRDRPFFATVQTQLRTAPGVLTVRADPGTAGVLIAHDGDLDMIAAFAREHNLFGLVASSTLRRSTQGATTGLRRSLNGMRPGSMVAAGLTGLGLYQATRGVVLGTATENLWNAYGAQAILRKPWLAVGFASLGLYQLARGQVLGSAASLLFYALSVRARGSDRGGTASE